MEALLLVELCWQNEKVRNVLDRIPAAAHGRHFCPSSASCSASASSARRQAQCRLAPPFKVGGRRPNKKPRAVGTAHDNRPRPRFHPANNAPCPKTRCIATTENVLGFTP